MGRFIIDFRNAAGEVFDRVEKDNLIPDHALLGLMGDYPQSRFFNRRIAISSWQYPPQSTVYDLPEVIAIGYVPNGVSSPSYYTQVTPHFGEIRNAIDPPSSGTRTFYTIALTHYQLAYPRTYAQTLLDIPCEQGEGTFLDLYYRVQIEPFSTQYFLNPERATREYGRQLTTSGGRRNSEGFFVSELYATPFSLPTQNYLNLWINSGTKIGSEYHDLRIDGTNVGHGYTTLTRVDSHFKYKYILDRDRNFSIGRIYNMMLQGQTDTGNCAYLANTFPYQEEPFQTRFIHSANSNRPFFSPASFGSSQGKMSLGGEWTGKIPELYKIIITGEGAVGTATYKWAVRKHLGFSGNDYGDLKLGCPFRHPGLASAEGMHGWQDWANDVHRWSNTQIVQYDLTGVTLLDVMDGQYSNWDEGNGLPVTSNQQTAISNQDGLIYVGCRDTGLWRINVATDSVSNIRNDRCYGVDVGRNEVAWAIFETGLFSSDDWNTPHTFDYTGISDGNWSQVYFLKADPEHADDRLGLVFNNKGGNNQVLWWDNVSGASEGYEDRYYNITPVKSLDVSDRKGFWVLGTPDRYRNTNKLYFGSSSRYNLYSSDGYRLLNGSVNFYQDKLITRDRLVNPDNTTAASYGSIDGEFVTHLDGGIVITSDYMHQLFDGDDAWTEYGWNGAEWLEGYDGSKVTHADAHPLGNGLTITFEDGQQQPHFVKDEFFTQGVNKGLLKDSATNVYYEFAWYTKPVIREAISITIPTEPPYDVVVPAALYKQFLRIESDSPKQHAFTIAGNPTAAIYTDGSIPAPGEITLLDGATGRLRFSEVDAGKTLEGTYVWLKSVNAATEVSQSTLLDDIISFWRLEETFNGEYYDSAGTNHLVPVNDVRQTRGKIGNGVQLQYSSAHLKAQNKTALALPNQSFTIAIWVYLRGTRDNQYFLSKYNTDTAQRSYALGFSLGDTDTFDFLVSSDGSSRTNVKAPGTNWNTEQWYFLVATHHQGERITISVDGAPPTSEPWSAGSHDADTLFLVGARNEGSSGGTARYTVVDAVGVWNRALTDAEVTELWNQGVGKEYPF